MDYLALLLHIFGDYITQTDWMAKNKTKSITAALIHAVVYSIPFAVVLHVSAAALGMICWTHMVIDHYRLARYVIFAKNWLNNPTIQWKDCNQTGYPNDMPPWMSVWLMIIADNFIHLLVNYLSIKYL